MKVVITYRTEEHLADAHRYFHRPTTQFHAIELDVSDHDAVARAADEAEQVFGPVDLLCSNAGVGVTTSIREATLADWNYAVAVNLWGVVGTVRAFLPRLTTRGTPAHIVATASMSGLFHGGYAGVYTTTKFAVVGMMEALRTELRGKNIGVSVFCPGLVRSRIFAASRNRPGVDANDRREQNDTELRIAGLVAAGMDAIECGRKVLEGVRRNDMYILTHPEFKQGLLDRCEALLGSFRDDGDIPTQRLEAEQRALRNDVYVHESDRQKKRSIAG
jgi:NAD(P)-dependent dehydrogenase (short-subunit alcohol dehydrogenase family)